MLSSCIHVAQILIINIQFAEVPFPSLFTYLCYLNLSLHSNRTDKPYYSDCSSKISSWSCNSGYTQSGSSCIKNDPCDNRTAVISSCPSNASCSYYSDCPSKISSWSCNSGYKKSGNSCLKLNDSCPVGYSKSDGCSCSYGFKSTRTEAGSICTKCCTAAQNPNGYQCMQCFNPDAGLRH